MVLVGGAEHEDLWRESSGEEKVVQFRGGSSLRHCSAM